MPKIEPPAAKDLQALLGDAMPLWQAASARVEALYDMEVVWHTGGKAAVYEKKYRRGGKTLCSFLAKEGAVGLLVVLGRAEQEKFEATASNFSPALVAAYHATQVYHDGRWLLLWLADDAQLDDMEKLLAIKRRPNRK